jgi:hypothetical protein
MPRRDASPIAALTIKLSSPVALPVWMVSRIAILTLILSQMAPHMLQRTAVGRIGRLLQAVRTGAPRTSDDLVTVAVGPHGDGLDESLRPPAVGLLFR